MKQSPLPGFSALLLLLIVSQAPACLDLSSLQEGFNQVEESPPVPEEFLDVSAMDAEAFPPDVGLPTTDVDIESLVGFDLAAVEPATGKIAGGEIVMLVGSGFHDDMEVFFGESKTTDPFVVTGNFATVETPPHLPGPVDVKIVGGEGEVAVLPAGFEYYADLLLLAVEPPQGPDPGGTPVVVAGTGFDASCMLFMGGRKATFVQVLDGFTIQAVTPPGNCGAADLTVLCNEEGDSLKDAFFYQGTPRVDAMSPKAGSASGGSKVHLLGRNFTPDMAIVLGETGVSPYDITFIAPIEVSFRAPPGEKGMADLLLTTECGETLVDDAFIYVEAEGGETGPPVIVGLTPLSLPACSGGFVTLGIENMGDVSSLQLFFGEYQADVVSVDEDMGTVDVTVPPGDPGAVQVEVLTPDGTAVAEQEFEFLDQAVIYTVSPGSGHPKGGTQVEVLGCGFDAQVELRFGANVGTNVQALSSTMLTAATPPGSPGPVDVIVTGAGSLALLPSGYTYLTDKPELYLLDPNYGSVAGGTYVRFYGAGLPPNAKFVVGGKECFDIHYVDSTLVTVRMPPNDVGTYDADVTWSLGTTTMEQAYTYFNPKSKKGGTWGGPIDESLNVTVLDSSTGKGLAGAFVMVGSEAENPHKGYTDENGQVTFSAPGFQGAQQITAARKGYNMYSVVHFDAANVTVYLNPIVSPGGGTYTPKEAFVGGRVFGLDKYVVLPPGDCANKNTGTVLCKPCESDDECAAEQGGPEGEGNQEGEEDQQDGEQAVPEDGYCAEIGDTGTFCVTPCLAPEDCPEGFICAKTSFEQTGCIPKSGEKAIRCISSKKSMFGLSPDPGPGGNANLHDIYFISTSMGEIAIVCYGGYTDPDTSEFFPTVMGIRRHVIVLPEAVLKDQDVHLNIPLNREARIAFHDLPFHPSGIRKPYMMISLELGKDGYLSLPRDPEWVEESGYYRLFPLPEQMTGPLLGTTYSIYSSVQSNTTYSLPYAVRMVTDVESLFGDGVIVVGEEEAENLFPPVDGDLVGMVYKAGNDIYVASNRGELFHYDGFAWTPVGLADTKKGFTVLEEDPNGGLWLGGANGAVWHFNSVSWKKVDTGQGVPVRDIWCSKSKAVVVYDTFLEELTEFGLLSTIAAPQQHKLKAAWASDSQDIYVLSDQFTIWNWSSEGWNVAAVFENYDLEAIDGAGPDDVWIAGSPGVILHWDGDAFEVFHVDQYKGLSAIRAVEPGKVFAAGEDGLLVSFNGTGFDIVETGTLQDFTCLDHAAGTATIAAAGIQAYNLGPFMAYPRIVMPEEDQVFDFSSLAWDYWSANASADFHFVILSSQDGFPFWYMTVDGEITQVDLPPIVQTLGINLFPEGPKRMNLTSTLNPDFDIDNYTLNDFSIYRKVSWAVDLMKFK